MRLPTLGRIVVGRSTDMRVRTLFIEIFASEVYDPKYLTLALASSSAESVPSSHVRLSVSVLRAWLRQERYQVNPTIF